MNSLFFVKTTSYCLNPNHVLSLWSDVVLQSITLTDNFSSIKIVLDYFFGSSTSSHLCFLWFEWNFKVTFCKLLWSNPSSICFTFNQNILSLFTSVFTSFLSYIFQPYLYRVFHSNFMIFCFFFLFIIFSQHMIYWNKFVMTKKWVD